jgi:GNAT superfamily N-acetyltransferase
MKSKIIQADISHLDEIIRIWGINRSTLGLMPKDAFIESIHKRWVLIVLTDDVICGYLLYRYTNRTQTVSIVHLCVEKESRGKGLSKMLVDKLVEINVPIAKGIKLSCRSDYAEAIGFWKKYNFQPREMLPSKGRDPNVHLIIWWFSFGKADLFSSLGDTKINAVLDINVIAKLRDQDSSDTCYEEIEHLLNGFLPMEVEFYQTSETKSEIFRDHNTERRRETKRFLSNFRELDIDKQSVNLLVEKLKAILPGGGENNLSDRRQVAEAILSGFPFFVTLDAGILKKKHQILECYQLKILKPSSLFLEIDLSNNPSDYYPSKLSGSNFSIKKVESFELDIAINKFLSTSNSERKNEMESKLNLVLKRSGIINVIKELQDPVALVTSYEDSNKLIVPVLRTKQYHLRQTIFMQNVSNLINEALKLNKHYLIIEDLQLTHVEKSILHSYGFTEFNNRFIKPVINEICSLEDLKVRLVTIRKEIPQLLEKFIVNLTNEELSATLYQVEKSLWPLKISDANIPCYIIPIKPAYARQLFDFQSANQDLFGVQPKLIWNKENVYYRNVRPDIEKFPARILWYASSDDKSSRQKAIVATSYLDEVVIGTAKDLFKKYERYGVYSWEKHIKILAKNDASRTIKVLRFSDSESFSNAIPFRKVKQILKDGGEADNNFQAPLKINPTTFINLYSLAKTQIKS